MGVVSVGVASIVGILLLLMLKSQERVCLPYRPSVVLRLVLSIFSGNFLSNRFLIEIEIEIIKI